jgi:IS5 family transposase
VSKATFSYINNGSLGKDVTGRCAYSGLLLFKMRLVGIYNGGLSDENVEE